jgi:hypothetical protein
MEAIAKVVEGLRYAGLRRVLVRVPAGMNRAAGVS